MNEVIDLNEMPAMFGMCNVKECALAETCLRQIVYPAVAKKKDPFLPMLNPEWLATQKGLIALLLKRGCNTPFRMVFRDYSDMP